jgi:hypothetical protein
MALERLSDDPQNDSLIKLIDYYIVELQDQAITLQKVLNSRSREDNFVKVGELIEQRIDEIILNSYESI